MNVIKGREMWRRTSLRSQERAFVNVKVLAGRLRDTVLSTNLYFLKAVNMRCFSIISFISRWMALNVLFGCSAPQSAYVGEAGEYQPPEDRTVLPLYCGDSDRSAFNNSMSPFRWGDKQVDVNVDVAVDFRCPYCTRNANAMDDLWQRRSDYRDRVRVTFHHFPNEVLHSGTTEIHVAAAAVAKQGFDNFWRLHDEIFARAAQGQKMDRAALDHYVENELELDFDRFLRDVEADETKDFVQWDKEQCRAADVEGTPSVFVCGAFLYDRARLEETIDEALAATAIEP